MDNLLPKTALILPYFGNLPNYFQKFLLSAGYNKEFDFMVFSDCDLSVYKIPRNVKVVAMTFEKIKSKISHLFDFKNVLHTPYKLCDYKPLYGLIFEEYLKGYEFWGHCDADIIWGKLSHFLTQDVFESADKIYRCGHLSFYRNVDYINHAALNKSTSSLVSYKDVYKKKYIAHFDENGLIHNLIEEVGGVLLSKEDCADITYFCKEFKNVDEHGTLTNVPYFRWKDGILLGFSLNNEKLQSKEYAYIHLQKRKMDVMTNNEQSFLIIPNSFIDDEELNVDEVRKLMERDKKYELRQRINNRKNQLKNIREGALTFRLKSFVQKILR